MLADLLTGEAHADPYQWLVVMLAHAALGAWMWLFSGRAGWRGVWRVSLAYLGVEAAQAALGGLLLWDAALDWSAVTLGAVVAAAIYAGRLGLARAAAAALALIGLAGVWRRR